MIWAKFWRRSKHNSHDGGEVKPDILKKKKDIKRKDRAQHLRSVRQSERFLAIVFFFPLRIIILASFCQMWWWRIWCLFPSEGSEQGAQCCSAPGKALLLALETLGSINVSSGHKRRFSALPFSNKFLQFSFVGSSLSLSSYWDSWWINEFETFPLQILWWRSEQCELFGCFWCSLQNAWGVGSSLWGWTSSWFRCNT